MYFCTKYHDGHFCPFRDINDLCMQPRYKNCVHAVEFSATAAQRGGCIADCLLYNMKKTPDYRLDKTQPNYRIIKPAPNRSVKKR